MSAAQWRRTAERLWAAVMAAHEAGDYAAREEASRCYIDHHGLRGAS